MRRGLFAACAKAKHDWDARDAPCVGLQVYGPKQSGKRNSNSSGAIGRGHLPGDDAPVIDDRSRRSDPLVNNLFVPHKELRVVPEVRPPATERPPKSADTIEGAIHSLKE